MYLCGRGSRGRRTKAHKSAMDAHRTTHSGNTATVIYIYVYDTRVEVSAALCVCVSYLFCSVLLMYLAPSLFKNKMDI